MPQLPDRTTFESAYSGKAPWDIGRPQQAFVAVADQITGSVLDAGCGTGENALFFAGRGCEVTGMDYLDEPIRRARRKGVKRGLSVTFIVMDALTLKAWPILFDTVIDSGLFHVFSDDDRRRYVEGLATVLNPGGRLEHFQNHCGAGVPPAFGVPAGGTPAPQQDEIETALFLLCFSDEEPGTQGPRRVMKKELHDAFAEGWAVETIEPSRYEVRPHLKDMAFGGGGPKAWFVVVCRSE